MSYSVSLVVETDDAGNIIDSAFGTNVSLSTQNNYNFVFCSIPVEVAQLASRRKYKVVMDGFKPTLVLKDGETPPVIPEPELTLEQKVELLEKELKAQQEMNLDFQNATYGTLDYLFSKQN